MLSPGFGLTDSVIYCISLKLASTVRVKSDPLPSPEYEVSTRLLTADTLLVLGPPPAVVWIGLLGTCMLEG